MKIAIHVNKSIFDHSTTWANVWIEYCEKKDLNYEVVDCFNNDIFKKIKNFDVLLWHFNNYSFTEMEFSRSILYSIKNLGVKVFPDINDSWHFDDKVAESYLLKSVQAPIPSFEVFYTLKDVKNYLRNDITFPLVAKLRKGSGSNHVKLINSHSELMKFSKIMFGKGIRPSPKPTFKTISHVKSSKNFSEAVDKAKRIPDFIQSINNSSQLYNEKGYVYLQEYIENDGYDIKVVVVGDKVSFFSRDIRKGDFRASGGGLFKYDQSVVTDEIRRIALGLNKKLGFQCMGYDFVIDKNTKKPKIIEMSYGFPYLAVLNAGGYWDSNNQWNSEPLNAPIEVLNNIINNN